MQLRENKTKDLMIDLETLGKSNNAVIVQIGACYFDRYTGEIGEKFLVNIDIEDACKYGKLDASTVLWWLQQSKEAQESVFNNSTRYSLKESLQFLTHEITDDIENVWCHPTFDWIILKSAYEAVGLEFPFKFWMARDLRTVVDLAEIDVYNDFKVEGIHHNALDDCLFQVKYLVHGINKLTGDK